MIKRHMAVIKKPDNTPEVNPMKEWFRLNPEYLPQGLDPNQNTSYQIRRAQYCSARRLHKVNLKILNKMSTKNIFPNCLF